MWKRENGPTQPSAPEPENDSAPERSHRSRAVGETPTIGRAVSIRGDIRGGEDIVIQGRVAGSVELEEHTVTVGPDGEVKANIVARVVIIEGLVEGDLIGNEQVVLRGTAWVQGDIIAPRVVLEDGARFRGGVYMDDMVEKGSKSGTIASSPPAGSPADASRESKQGNLIDGNGASNPSTGKGKKPTETTVEAVT